MKKRYLLLVLVLLFVGVIFTYALFRSTTRAYATFDVANWNVIVKVNGVRAINNEVNVSLMDKEWSNDLSTVAEGKIAPGSYTTFDIEIDATGTEVPVEYQVLFDNLDELSGFKVELDSQEGVIEYSKEGSMKKIIPVRVTWESSLDDSDYKDYQDIELNGRNMSLNMRIITSQLLEPLCTVTLDLNDGSTTSIIKTEKNKSIKNLPHPDRIGYIFKGWYTQKVDGDLIKNTTRITEDITLYAHWEINEVTVTFNTNGGNSIQPVTLKQGGKLISLPEPIKDNYIFNGWYTKEIGGELVSIDDIIMNDITYYARYNELQLGKIVYFDPVTSNECNEYTYDIDKIRSGESTCYRWRIIDPDTNNDKINIQLDHNILNNVKWNSNTSLSSDGPVLAIKALEGKTRNWYRVEPITYTYDTSASLNSYGTFDCFNGQCSFDKDNKSVTVTSDSRARLITGEEIMTIINTKADGAADSRTWTLDNPNAIFFSSLSIKTGYTNEAFGDTRLSWLIENTTKSNTTGSTSNLYGEDNDGYWTLSPSSKNSSYASMVTKYGDFESYVLYNNNYGIRPVIHVSKDLLK